MLSDAPRGWKAPLASLSLTKILRRPPEAFSAHVIHKLPVLLKARAGFCPAWVVSRFTALLPNREKVGPAGLVGSAALCSGVGGTSVAAAAGWVGGSVAGAVGA